MATLQKYELEIKTGQMLNELCENYCQQFPHKLEDRFPNNDKDRELSRVLIERMEKVIAEQELLNSATSEGATVDKTAEAVSSEILKAATGKLQLQYDSMYSKQFMFYKQEGRDKFYEGSLEVRKSQGSSKWLTLFVSVQN